MLNSGLKVLFNDGELEKWSDNKTLSDLWKAKGGDDPAKIGAKMVLEGKVCVLVLLVNFFI